MSNPNVVLFKSATILYRLYRTLQRMFDSIKSSLISHKNRGNIEKQSHYPCHTDPFSCKLVVPQ